MRTQEDRCPECGYEVDSATCPDDLLATPAEGDLSVCLKCATPLKFNKELYLQALTEDEFVELDADVRSKLIITMLAVAR